MQVSRRGFGGGALAALASGGWAAGGPAISGQDLKADLEVVLQAYDQMHPGFYRYATPAQMRARFDRTAAELSGGADLGQAYLALARLTGAVRCGHTYPNFFNQKKATAERLFGARDRLPFHFCWLGRRMIVLRDLSSPARLPRGTEVLAIDGRPVGAILDRLMPLSRADGSNDAKRVRNLELRGEDRIAAFDVYYSLLFRPHAASVRLRVRAPGGAPREVEVQAMTGAERLALEQAGAAPAPEDGPIWDLRLDDRGGPAVLRMPNWVAYDSKRDWRADLNRDLDRVVDAKAKALIVDLRGNEGGSDVGDVILSRLAARDLPRPRYDRYVRYRRAPQALEPYLDTWDKSFLDWGKDAGEPDARGLRRMTRFDDEDGADLIRPEGRRFTGRMVVLTDASNSSATFQFALAARRAGLATLIGQTTGGNLRGINGGAFFFLRLPGSGLEVDLPLIGYFPDAPQPDAGLEPDVKVTPSLQAIVSGEDLEMAAAKAWLTRA